MTDLQIPYDQVKNTIQAYIKTFNEDYQLGDSPQKIHPLSAQLIQQWKIIQPQLTINIIQIKNQSTTQMVSINQVSDLIKTQVNKLNQQKYYRIAIVLNTLNGDLQTFTANQVVCFGDDGINYWLLSKEPAQDNDGTYYYYELTSISNQTDINELFQNVNYLMTDKNLQDVLNSNDKLDGFVSLKQQRALIKNSILKINDFENFYN